MHLEAQPAPITIILPVYDDWESFYELLVPIDRCLSAAGRKASVLAVNDASTAAPSLARFQGLKLQSLQKIEILELGRNLGHQRAIAVGLAFLDDRWSQSADKQAIVVMDSDGEDDPNDILRLLAKFDEENGEKLIFAKRSKRSESLRFRVFYSMYRLLYRMLTGTTIAVGNYSVIPRKILARLVVTSEIWNHYSSGALKARVPYAMIDTRRALRLRGRSRMNFTALVMHGLSAISIHSDTLGVRALIGSAALVLIAMVAIIIVTVVRLATSLAIPGWASYLVASLLIIMFQGIIGASLFAFMTLNGRNFSSFLPKKDYRAFVLGVETVYG